MRVRVKGEWCAVSGEGEGEGEGVRVRVKGER